MEDRTKQRGIYAKQGFENMRSEAIDETREILNKIK
jgi:hypothetical protein